jgi:hypothetical protein
MNVAIANILLGQLTALPWLQKYAGLVKVVTTMDGKKKVTLPYAINVVTGDCETKTRTDLVPNSNYRSVLYFEEVSGISAVHDPKTGGWLAETELRIVAWLNGKKMTWNSEQAFMSIMKELDEIPVNWSSGDYAGITILDVTQEAKTESVFTGKYTYNTTEVGFLMHPHDYMSMRVKVKYLMSPSCFEDTLVLLDECGVPI